MTTALPENVRKEIREALMAGFKMKEIAKIHNVGYAQVAWLRKQMVNARILKPLRARAVKKKHVAPKTTTLKSAVVNKNRMVASNTLTNTGMSVNNDGQLQFVVNGTTFRVSNAKTIEISKGEVSITTH